MTTSPDPDVLRFLAEDVRNLEAWIEAGFAAETYDLEPQVGDIVQALDALRMTTVEQAIEQLPAAEASTVREQLAPFGLDGEGLASALARIATDPKCMEIVDFSLRAAESEAGHDDVVSLLPRGPEVELEVIHRAIDRQDRGFKDALTQLYDVYDPRVRYAVAHAAQRLRSRADIVQLRKKVWRRLVADDERELRYYDASQGPFGPYIQRLAFHHALAMAGSDVGSSDRAPKIDSSGARLLQSPRYRDLVSRASARLDATEHLVLREVYLAGRTLDEVAAEHGVSADVLDAYHRGLGAKVTRWAQELSPDGLEHRSV